MQREEFFIRKARQSKLLEIKGRSGVFFRSFSTYFRIFSDLYPLMLELYPLM